MHPRIREIMMFLADKPVAWSLLTNGSLVSESMAGTIAACRPFHVQVSIDGGTDETFRILRGYSLESVRSGIRMLKDKDLTVVGNAILHRANASEQAVEALQGFCQQVGVDSFGYSFLEPIGRAYAYYRRLAPSVAQYESIAELYPQLLGFQDSGLAAVGCESGSSASTKSAGYMHACDPGRTDLVVSPTGRLAPCTYYQMTNLFRGMQLRTPAELGDVWRNASSFELVRAQTRGYHCVVQGMCRLFERGICMRCQAVSWQHFGNPYAPHPWCVLNRAELDLAANPYVRELAERIEHSEVTTAGLPHTDTSWMLGR